MKKKTNLVARHSPRRKSLELENATSVPRVAVACDRCVKRPAIKTDGSGRPLCEKCARGGGTPIVGSATPARNGGCPCGSGKKYKKCCGR